MVYPGLAKRLGPGAALTAPGPLRYFGADAESVPSAACLSFMLLRAQIALILIEGHCTASAISLRVTAFFPVSIAITISTFDLPSGLAFAAFAGFAALAGFAGFRFAGFAAFAGLAFASSAFAGFVVAFAGASAGFAGLAASAAFAGFGSP